MSHSFHGVAFFIYASPKFRLFEKDPDFFS